MKHLDDRRSCPHCGEPTNEQPYLMSRRASEDVMDLRVAFWVVALALLLTILVR